MWIGIEVVPDSQEVLYLPGYIAEKLDREVKISFGSRACYARVLDIEDFRNADGHNFENPLKIRISNKLAYNLKILRSPTYRMKYSRENIIIGPVIGLLLGNHDYLYNPEHMGRYSDRFGIYSRVGGLIYAFCPRAVNWEDMTIYGLYYNHKISGWKYARFPFPSAIYRRDFHSDPKVIRRLTEITEGRLFNSWRFSKLFLYEYMGQDEVLSPYLPPYRLSSSFMQIKEFIDKYQSIILKPISLSRGRGICIIRKEGEIYSFFDYRHKKPAEAEFKSDNELKDFLVANKLFFHGYLIQKHISLAKVDGANFDIRVVMQKERPPVWRCTGIECRVAAKGNLITNISRGGYPLTIDEALKRAFGGYPEKNQDIRRKLDVLCIKICESLDKMGHHFGEFGVDIAVDEYGNLWIIEVNVFPSFKGFKKLDYETYLDIRHTPVIYAAYLAGF